MRVCSELQANRREVAVTVALPTADVEAAKGNEAFVDDDGTDVRAQAADNDRGLDYEISVKL